MQETFEKYRKDTDKGNFKKYSDDTRQYSKIFFMVTLWNRADHYIFALSFVLSLFFLA